MEQNWRATLLAKKDSTWMQNAKCRKQQKPLDLFFETFEQSKPSVKNEMVTFCFSCDVINECFQHAQEVGETGLWGGAYFVNGKPQKPSRAQYREDARDNAARKKCN